MVFLKKLYFFFFYFLLIRNKIIDSKIIVDSVYNILGSSFKPQFIYFNKKVYKIHLHRYPKDDYVQAISIEENNGSKWEVKKKFFYKKVVDVFYSFVIDGELIIIYCDHVNSNSLKCLRYSTFDGTLFKESKIDFPELKDKNGSFSSYSSQPTEILGKKYIMICDLLPNLSWDGAPKLFSICYASHDKGYIWDTVFYYYYIAKPEYKYYKLKLRVSKDSLGFQFVKTSGSRSLGSYIECEHDRSNNFKCSDVNLDRSDKFLQAVYKVKDFYLTAYLDDETESCSLVYSKEDALLVKEGLYKNKNHSCTPRDIIRLEDGRMAFICSFGVHGEGIYILHLYI